MRHVSFILKAKQSTSGFSCSNGSNLPCAEVLKSTHLAFSRFILVASFCPVRSIIWKYTSSHIFQAAQYYTTLNDVVFGYSTPWIQQIHIHTPQSVSRAGIACRLYYIKVLYGVQSAQRLKASSLLPGATCSLHQLHLLHNDRAGGGQHRPPGLSSTTAPLRHLLVQQQPIWVVPGSSCSHENGNVIDAHQRPSRYAFCASWCKTLQSMLLCFMYFMLLHDICLCFKR